MKKLNKLIALALASATITGANTSFLPLVTYAEREAKDYSIDGLYWEDGDTQILAGWDESEDKTAYKVKLFRNDKGITAYLTTNSTTYDFTSSIIEHGTGTYKFYVYPQKLGQDSKKSSEALKIDSEMLYDLRRNNPNIVSAVNAKKKNTNNKTTTSTNKTNNTGTSSGASTGLNGGPGTSNKFANGSSISTNTTSNTKSPSANISSTKSATPESAGSWQLDNNIWYFIDANTNMRASNDWRFVNNKWYFFNEDTSMKTGWLEWKGSWYYFGTDGAMLSNTTTPDGYKLDINGAWIK